MKKFCLSLLCLFSFGSQSVFALGVCPEQVRVTFLDFAIPPLIFGIGTKFEDPPGYLIDWVQQAVINTGCQTKAVLSRRPMKRGFFEAYQDQTDIFTMASPSAERLGQVVFPMVNGVVDKRLAYLGTSDSLWVLKGERSIHWDGVTLTGPPEFRVGVSAGTILETIATERGWRVDLANNGANSIDKLIAGRVLVALVGDAIVQSAAEDKRVRLEKLAPIVETTYYYNTPSMAFYASYPDFMGRYWQELCKLSRVDLTVFDQGKLPACP